MSLVATILGTNGEENCVSHEQLIEALETRIGGRNRKNDGDHNLPAEIPLVMTCDLFAGCWHCGESGHSRTTRRGKDRKPECTASAILVKEHDGLPNKHAGAYAQCAKDHDIS